MKRPHNMAAMKALHNETLVEFFKDRARRWLVSLDFFPEVTDDLVLDLAGEFATIYAEGASDGEAAYRGE
jgi:hypothetical protein